MFLLDCKTYGSASVIVFLRSSFKILCVLIPVALAIITIRKLILAVMSEDGIDSKVIKYILIRFFAAVFIVFLPTVVSSFFKIVNLNNGADCWNTVDNQMLASLKAQRDAEASADYNKYKEEKKKREEEKKKKEEELKEKEKKLKEKVTDIDVSALDNPQEMPSSNGGNSPGSSGGAPAQGSGKMGWPLTSGGRSTWGFEWRNCPYHGREHHTGVDISASSGEQILAADSGVVVRSTVHSSYGNYIVINHGNGFLTWYCHCLSLSVAEGQNVKKGDVIGLVGMTGTATGPHLHFMVQFDESFKDPGAYFPMPAGQDPGADRIFNPLDYVSQP